MEYKMHRAIKIATGEVIEVTDVLANDPNLLLQYGFMLQPLPEEDITEELKANWDMTSKPVGEINSNGLTIDVEHVQEPSEREQAKYEIELNTSLAIEKALEAPEVVDALKNMQQSIADSKPKRSYNKQIK